MKGRKGPWEGRKAGGEHQVEEKARSEDVKEDSDGYPRLAKRQRQPASRPRHHPERRKRLHLLLYQHHRPTKRIAGRTGSQMERNYVAPAKYQNKGLVAAAVAIVIIN